MMYLLAYVLLGLLAIFNQVVLDVIDENSRDFTAEQVVGMLLFGPVALAMQFGYVVGSLINYAKAKT